MAVKEKLTKEDTEENVDPIRCCIYGRYEKSGFNRKSF